MEDTQMERALEQSNKPAINFIPALDKVVITAYVQKRNSNIILGPSDRPAFTNIQQVVAVGGSVREYNVGDWVYIDFSKYMVDKVMDGKAIAGVGGKKYVERVLEAPIFVAPGDEDNIFLKVGERELEGKIADFKALPESYRMMETLMEYNNEREAQLAKMKQERDAAGETSPAEVRLVSNPPAKFGGQKRKR